MSHARKRIVAIASIGAAGLAAAALVASPVSGSQAAAQRGARPMTCAFSSADAAMRVTVHDWGENSYFWITRDGNRLIPRKSTYPHHAHAVPCQGGTPTVNNVDHIKVDESNPPGSDGLPSASQFELDMSPNAFAPGATRERGGRAEIETLLDLPGAQVVVAAPQRADRLTFGVKHSHLALNASGDSLKADDSDLDVEFAKTASVELLAGRGRDIVHTRTRHAIEPRRPRLYVFGGSGNDLLVGGGHRDQLYGGHGVDWVDGTHGAGLLNGGSGADRLIAGPEGTLLQGKDGPDLILARNGHRDWVGCGPGDDHARLDSREENVVGCEHARPAKTRFRGPTRESVRRTSAVR